MPKEKILVIEDDNDIRDIICYYLEEAGFTVVAASHANYIVELAKNENPCLITLDIKLPGTDGTQAIQLLKNDAATAKIPILVISVLAKDPKVQKLSVNGFIAKPFERDELLNAVKMTLPSSPPSLHNQKVLIVDDEPDVVRVIAEHLKTTGFIPVEAYDGEEAIKKVAQEKPALIILDIRMPKVDGFQVLNVLNQKHESWSIPVIVLSGVQISNEDKQKGQHMGVVRFLTKPFEAKQLLNEVQNVLKIS